MFPHIAQAKDWTKALALHSGILEGFTTDKLSKKLKTQIFPDRWMTL